MKNVAVRSENSQTVERSPVPSRVAVRGADNVTGSPLTVSPKPAKLEPYTAKADVIGNVDAESQVSRDRE